jgi:hypothetical protein
LLDVGIITELPLPYAIDEMHFFPPVAVRDTGKFYRPTDVSCNSAKKVAD